MNMIPAAVGPGSSALARCGNCGIEIADADQELVAIAYTDHHDAEHEGEPLLLTFVFTESSMTDDDAAAFVAQRSTSTPSPLELALQAIRDDPNVNLAPATVAAIDAALPPTEEVAAP